jgi:SET domain-containing protein
MSFIRRKSKRITHTKKAEQNLKFILTTSDMSLLKLCVKNTNEMGRGVFCTSSITKGDYVLEYRGTRLNEEESKTRNNEIGDTGKVLYIYWIHSLILYII